MKTFVFFIGGTGARVLRSLSMLMASGVSLKDGDSIVPIIVDFDATNADLKRTHELLGAYNELHEICGYATDHFDGGFFRTPLGIEENGRYKNFDSLEKITFPVERSSFGKYIGYDSMSTISSSTKYLIDSLYDTSAAGSRDTELNLELQYGFKGNPNIGSVVFNEYFETAQFKNFKNNFSRGDRVFIVASIFGGTGSSGLPQIVKRIREKASEALQDNASIKDLREAMLGTCIVLPYFKVKENANSAINSLTFNSKAKAALGFYHDEINKDLSEVYYIGCDQQSVGYENVEGGEKQENNAHLVELLSAISVIEFASHNEMKPDDPTRYYEYVSTSVDPSSFPDPAFRDVLQRPGQGYVYQTYLKKLNAFALASKFFREKTRNQGNKLSFLRDSYYRNLEDFLAPGKNFSEKLFSYTGQFIKWAGELSSNSVLKFMPYDFRVDKSYELIRLDSSNKFKKIDMDNIIATALNSGTKEENSKNSTGDKSFLRHLYPACIEAVSKIV